MGAEFYLKSKNLKSMILSKSHDAMIFAFDPA
jgi:hypothetical protein